MVDVNEIVGGAPTERVLIAADGADKEMALAALGRRPVFVIGGRQRAERGMRDLADGWYGYSCGVILRIDDTEVTTVKEYRSRPGTCGPDDAVLFKAASRVGDRLHCCTQTEVLAYDVTADGLVEQNHVSLPFFNDVHHVVPTSRGTLLVAVSGIETVVEITESGELVREWDVLGEGTWDRVGRERDLRCGVDLKPHRAHPNHITVVGDEAFVTRFELRDIISLDDPARRVEPHGERLHDGSLSHGRFHLTSVDGEVIVADAETLEILSRRLLVPLGGGNANLGWCRGLLADGDAAWIGFSRIRPTALRQTVSWIRTRGVSQVPTRIARHRLDDGTCEAEIDLEPFGLNAVFSVVDA